MQGSRAIHGPTTAGRRVMRSRRCLYVTIALLVVAACDRVGPAEPEAERVAPGDLVLAVREIHGFGNTSVGEPEVGLFLNTERVYPCFNYFLDATTDVQERTITVRVSDVIVPVICLAAFGPAMYRTSLPVTDGVYTLRIVNGLATDEFVLEVTAAAVELRRQTASFTRLSLDRAWRYPHQSFATVCNAAEGGEARCEEFRAAVLTAVPLERFEFGEGGEVPYPQSFSNHGQDWRAEYYRYAAEEDFAGVGAVVQSFAARYPGVWLYVVNWRNEAYRSWVVPD